MQVRRRPWLSLLACMAAVGAARAQDTKQDLISAPVELRAAPFDAAAPGKSQNWRMAPIFTSGSVSYDLRSSFGGDQPAAVSQLVTTSLNAATYIYQPWFATVNGTLGLTLGRSRTRGDSAFEDSFGRQDSSSKDRFLTGSVQASVFPRSRFPFEAKAERSDSRLDSGLASTFDFKTQNIGFTQRYEPVNRTYAISATYNRRETIGADVRDTQDQVSSDFNTRWKHNTLSVGLSMSQAWRNQNADRSQFRSLVSLHTYAPNQALSVNTTVNATQTKEQTGSFNSDLSVLQWSSVGLWRAEGSRLQLSGSARGLLARDALTEQEVASGGLTLGASYELNRNVQLSASGGVNANRSGGNSAQVFTGNVGANWQGDSLEFRGVQYSSFAGASAGGSVAGGSGDNLTQTTLSTQLGHTLNRVWLLPMQSNLSLSLGQSLGASTNRSNQGDPSGHGSDSEEDAASPTSVMLLHTLSATWTVDRDARTAYARASYNDSRELGGGQSRFQMFNFQLSGNFAIDRNQSLGGDLTFQRSVQNAGPSDGVGTANMNPGGGTSSAGASGNISYSHRRLFGIPRLRFTSRLNLARDMLNQPGTLATLPDRETRLWENRLDYLVGRLETQLVLRLAYTEGKRRGLLMWRLQRSFGN
jgi:hypothetical protein